MKIELEKTMLTGMLTMLGKLVNRSAADRSFLALRLEAKDGTLAPVRDSAEAELHGNTPVRTTAPQNNPVPQSCPAQSRRSEIAPKTAKTPPNGLQIDRRTVYYALEDAVQGSNERKHAA